MSDFEEYIKVNYPRDYERQKRIYPDQSVEELYSEDYRMWQHQQAIIDALKAQLNNMEACYIEKKKQVEDALHILDELYRKGLFAKPKAVSEAINVLRGGS